MAINRNGLGIIILAGGKSSRMGQDKAFLTFGKTTLIELLIEKSRNFEFSEIIVVTNDVDKYQGLGVKIVKDFYPGQGPLAGIHSGLTHSSFWNNFVIPCDMPFFSKDLVKKLLNNQGDCKVVVPTMDNKFQPLAALYTKDCIPHIQYLLENKISKVIKLYDLVKTCYLELADDTDFFNINTPHDFLEAKRFLEEDFENGKG